MYASNQEAQINYSFFGPALSQPCIFSIARRLKLHTHGLKWGTWVPPAYGEWCSSLVLITAFATPASLLLHIKPLVLVLTKNKEELSCLRFIRE